MPTVTVAFGEASSHDISLEDILATKYGFIFAGGGVRVMQEVPLSPPAAPFANEQQNWIGGRGRVRYIDDPTGFFDSTSLWSTTEGKLFPSLQWRFADGIRSHTTLLPGDNQDVAWWQIYGDTPASQIARYLSVTFTPSASYTATAYYVILRRRGTPGTLTLEVCSDSTGSPGAVLQTITKTVSDITDTLAVYLPFSASQSLTSGTVYHLKIYGAATDSAANHWEVLTNDDGTASKYSAAGSVWTSANVSMYHRVAVADIKRQWRFFMLEGALYACDQKDDGTTSALYINGIRGTATSATPTTLVVSTFSMTTDAYAGAYIRIFDGTGDGQVRQITSNTATAFTVPTWDITPDATSRFIVYGTDFWTVIGSTGLAAISDKVVVGDKIAYFPQGTTAMRRMRNNASSHDFAADSTNTAGLLYVQTEGTTPLIYAGNRTGASIRSSETKVWNTDLAFGTAKYIGSSDYRLTNMIGHNKVLHIFKEDGVYTYSGNSVEKLGSGFENVPDPTTGLGAASKDNFLWFGWGHSIERMAGASVSDMMNWKLGYDGMGSDKKGYVSSVVSAVGWLFVGICGDANNYSTILCWNGYGWHEIYRSWKKNALIRNMFWQPNIGSRSRLWFDVDGDMAYLEFPQYAANPLKDTSQNYNYEGALVTSTYDNRDPQLYKIISMLRVYSEQGGCEIDYQTNANVGTNTWTVLGTADTQPVEDFNIDAGSVFQIRFRFRLQITHTRTPCILTGWQMSGRMIPLDKYQWIFSFRLAADAETYTDEPDHDPNTLYEQIKTWANNQSKLTMRAQSQSADNKIVTVSLPSKTVDWIDGTEFGGHISFACLET